jgi:hypothetical protein
MLIFSSRVSKQSTGDFGLHPIAELKRKIERVPIYDILLNPNTVGRS